MTLADALLRHEPLLVEPTILAAFVERCGGLADRLKELLGEPPRPEVIDGVGVIPIRGVIGHRLAPIERLFGAHDVRETSETLDAFAKDPAVRSVLFEVDSPGGTVTGVPELAEKIAAFPKPTAAFTGSLAASAAYWLASRADRVFATPSASVGGVGVFLPLLDSSAAFALSGLKMEVIRAGKFKGVGMPGTALTPEQRQHLQERVEQIHGLFRNAVQAKRRFVQDESLQGQTFLGTEALGRNIVSDLVQTRAEALAKLTR